MKDKPFRPEVAETSIEARRLRVEDSPPNRESRHERAATARLLIRTQRLLNRDGRTH